MSEPSGIVFDIKKFSIHDGPGIRTTVFLKGCPLHCSWCHNPEGISPLPEIHFWEKRCINCHDCVNTCEHQAISFVNGERVHHPGICQGCGACAEACPTEATELVGTRMTVSEVICEIEQDIICYDQSGGGATFSGGEPLLQIDFLEALLAACNDRGIHTVVDTSGHVHFQNIRRIQSLVDLFLYDIKIMDASQHYQSTGVPNHRILENLRKLVKTGSQVIVRIPIIPGVNDEVENIQQTGEFLAALESIHQVNILPYHRAAMDKYQRMDTDYLMGEVLPPTVDQMKAIAEQLGSFGISVSIGG